MRQCILRELKFNTFPLRPGLAPLTSMLRGVSRCLFPWELITRHLRIQLRNNFCSSLLFTSEKNLSLGEAQCGAARSATRVS